MTLDSSAVLAILREEPERDVFTSLIENDPRVLMSTMSVLEASIVIESRYGPGAGADLDAVLRGAGVEIVPFDGEQLEIARFAFRRFGKGRHPACLNFGDCASYALAELSGEPLLFKGDDFSRTDVRRVLGG